MKKPVTKSAILDDGLRYKSKVSGSPFVSTPYLGASTMSCFLCGKHRPRAQLFTRKLLGKSQAVCSPKCS
jgi:hypothetical protein